MNHSHSPKRLSKAHAAVILSVAGMLLILYFVLVFLISKEPKPPAPGSSMVLLAGYVRLMSGGGMLVGVYGLVRWPISSVEDESRSHRRDRRLIIPAVCLLLVSLFFFVVPIIIASYSKPSIMIIDASAFLFVICWPIGAFFGVAGLYCLFKRLDNVGTVVPRSHQFACHACGAQGFTAINDRCPSCGTPLN